MLRGRPGLWPGYFTWDAEQGLCLAFGVDLYPVNQSGKGLFDQDGRPAGEGGFHLSGEGLQFVAGRQGRRPVLVEFGGKGVAVGGELVTLGSKFAQARRADVFGHRLGLEGFEVAVGRSYLVLKKDLIGWREARPRTDQPATKLSKAKGG